MTGRIVSINEAFSADVPADAHAGVFLPLVRIPCAFSHVIALPNVDFFHEKIVDGDGVLDNAFPFNFLRLPFLPTRLFPVFPWQNSGRCHWIFGRGPDKIGGKDHVKRIVEEYCKDFIKTSKAVIDHQTIIKFQTLPQPVLDTDFHGI